MELFGAQPEIDGWCNLLSSYYLECTSQNAWTNWIMNGRQADSGMFPIELRISILKIICDLIKTHPCSQHTYYVINYYSLLTFDLIGVPWKFRSGASLLLAITAIIDWRFTLCYFRWMNQKCNYSWFDYTVS